MSTSAERSSRRPVVEHDVTVVDACWLTPRSRRLVFAGDGLVAGFTTPPRAYAPYFKLVLGSEGRTTVRTYSIRHLDAARDELHVDFIFHDQEGPGSAFGRMAGRGARARLRGPGHLAIARCTHNRLAADHCALPALGHLLEHLPRDAVGTAMIEVPHEAEILPLRAPVGIPVEWLVRPDDAPSLLASRFAGQKPGPVGDTLVWAGAEADIARSVRRVSRKLWSTPAPQCQVLNYWTRGRSEGEFSFVT